MKFKNVFKKNQVIIFALAIMIIVAGYLNFFRDKEKESEVEDAASSAIQEAIQNQEGDSFADISDEDILGSLEDDQNVVVVNDPVATDGDLALEDDSQIKDEVKDEVKEDIKEEVKEDEKVTAAPAEDKESKEESDKKKEDDVADAETSVPGEAVLASNQINSSYFATAKLTREQTRAKNKENLMSIISNENLSEEQKNQAVSKLQNLTEIAEKETATEILLEAKGFDGVVVSIVDDSADVIVNAPTLTDQDKAIIEDVVLRKTGFEAENIVIYPVVMED